MITEVALVPRTEFAQPVIKSPTVTVPKLVPQAPTSNVLSAKVDFICLMEAMEIKTLALPVLQ